ncbi:DUF4013 domain-containing protein [Halobiforma nitratireducens]|uniref:DUF4013 domain-containing protein n=1 Tax=Halobiforma nitratireducens JCM 10879 TaxID=1227454 RepID=M0LYS7_9EURY|nr:DUF4013 domain-containing protein [Halobiforma nitratireducens]EMA38586.1 hypothetical protein C446_09825 [Halobiforma nitratireducens JCM 10879]
MLEDRDPPVHRYPVYSPWLERTIRGSLLVLGSILFLPALLLGGYCVRVLETTLAGRDEPPRLAPLSDWRGLSRRGLGVVTIASAYVLAPLAAGVAVGVVVGAVGYYALAALAPVVAGNAVARWGISALAAALAALFALLVVGATLLVYYALPAAIVRYAETGSVRAAFDRRAVVTLAFHREYAFAVAILQVVPLLVPVAAVAALATVVGVVAVPAVPFLAAVGCSRLLGVAAVSIDSRNDSESSRSATPRETSIRADRTGR